MGTNEAMGTNDELTRDLITYCRLIIQEALRHGGQGWQEYDRSFHAQAAIESTLHWNGLLPDLQATTTLGQWAGVDHFVLFAEELTIQPCSVPWAKYNSHWYPIKQ